jgi:flagellar hook-basal body complex protein FliE
MLWGKDLRSDVARLFAPGFVDGICMMFSNLVGPPASALAGILAGAPAGAGGAAAAGETAPGGQFLDLIHAALQNVSAAQGDAATAEAGFVAGVPGASLGRALVASDRAEVAWNATVAVRNEVVSAYQSIMNMQF